MSDETKDTTVAVVLVQCSAHGTKGVLVGDTRITTSECCGTWDKVLHHWPRVPSDFIARALDQFAALRAPAPSEAVAWLIEKPQPGGVYWWHGKRHALAAINEDYNPDHFPSAIAYEFGPVAAEAVRFNSREDADVVIRRFPPQWRSVLIASEHMWVSAHPAPARGVTVTEAMVRAAQNAPVCALHVGWNGNNESIECDDCLRNALTAALTTDAEGGA